MAVLRLPPPLRRSKQNASAEIPYPCPSSDGDTPAAPKLPAPEACTAILPAASATPSSCRAGLSKLTALPTPCPGAGQAPASKPRPLHPRPPHELVQRRVGLPATSVPQTRNAEHQVRNSQRSIPPFQIPSCDAVRLFVPTSTRLSVRAPTARGQGTAIPDRTSSGAIRKGDTKTSAIKHGQPSCNCRNKKPVPHRSSALLRRAKRVASNDHHNMPIRAHPSAIPSPSDGRSPNRGLGTRRVAGDVAPC